MSRRFTVPQRSRAQVSAPYFCPGRRRHDSRPRLFRRAARRCSSEYGIVVGELRDPMMGQTVGVKPSVRNASASKVPDPISMDTDFVASIRRHGWKTEYVGKAPGVAHASRTLGEHRPDYTAAYTYRKHIIEGGRLRYRERRRTTVANRPAGVERPRTRATGAHRARARVLPYWGPRWAHANG